MSSSDKSDIKDARTEILYGAENAVGMGIRFMSNVRKRMDITFDYRGPSIVTEIPAYWDGYLDICRRGGEIRVVTEITTSNVKYCKQIAKIARVRHMGGMMGGVAVNETEYMATTTLEEAKPLTQVIYSNVKEVVKQGSSLFESLWENAIPAEDRIRELDEGIEPERTRIMYGSDQILRYILESFSNIRETLDSCLDVDGPSMFFENSDLLKAYTQLKDRGIRLRFITDITAVNLSYCKRLAKIAELRHLDRVKGTFGISDKREYAASGVAHAGEVPSRLIVSTARVFVEQQQYSFETLWEKATNAKQRISQIEEGSEPEYIRSIANPDEVQSTIFDLIDKGKYEIRIMFSTPNAFRRQKRAGGLQYVIAAAKKRKLRIRLLVPFDINIQAEFERFVAELLPSLQSSKQAKQIVDIMYIEPAWQTKISLLIIDARFSLAVELEDDSKESIKEAIGLATLSNSRATVSSYVSMFESLWMQNELHQKLKARSMMQNEFVNIAAHELRTPIQPIIGLADILHDEARNKRQRDLISIIIRNARRLKILADNILDVTRIESQSLILRKEQFSLIELVADSLQDAKSSQDYRDGKIQLTYKLAKNKALSDDDDLVIVADKEMISRVIRNLLDNALEFTKEGSVAVEVTKMQAEVNNNKYDDADSYDARKGTRNDDRKIYAVVSVKDTGPGISQEVFPIMFEKFASKSERGTGLGLFISKGIVEAHGGRIWGENNLRGKRGKKGATFSFTLPIKNKDER